LHLHKVMAGAFAKKVHKKEKDGTGVTKEEKGGKGAKKEEKGGKDVKKEEPGVDMEEAGPLVGMKVRVVDEAIMQIFGAPANVKRHRGEELLLEVAEDFRTWKVQEDQVEVVALVGPASQKKPLTLNAGDKCLLLAKFPDICNVDGEGLKMDERLSGDHLLLQDWMSCRDLSYDTQGSKFVMPTILYQFVKCQLEPGDEALLLQEKARSILSRQFKRFGLLGLPIFSDHTDDSAHWTLLILRKIREHVHVRYYDSATNENVFNRSIATDILDFLRHEFNEHKFPDVLPLRANSRSRQINGVDCGVFTMWFWEGEMRRFAGEGWSLPFPSTSQKGPIWRMRERLVGLVRQLQKMAAAKAKADEKHGGEGAADASSKTAEDILEEEGCQVTTGVLASVELKSLAEKSFKEGTVPFYGCGKCRFGRGGCIFWKCNPDKFAKHFAEHPEKYNTSKELKIEALKKITNKELVGGGCEVQASM